MSGKIRITPEEMRGTSRVFKSKSDETQGILKQLDGEISKLEADWEGMAQSAFVSEYNGLKPTLNKFVQLLSEVSTQLNQIASTMETTDSGIASKIHIN